MNKSERKKSVGNASDGSFFTLLLFFLYIVLYRLHTLLPARMKRKKLYFVKNEQKGEEGHKIRTWIEK